MAWRFTGRAHGMKKVGHGGPALLRRRTPHLLLLPCCRHTRAFFVTFMVEHSTRIRKSFC